jgi:hypothetical protein
MLKTYKYILKLHGEIMVKYTIQFTWLTRSRTKTHHKIIIHLKFYLNDEKKIFSLLWIYFKILNCKSTFQVDFSKCK